MDIKEVKKPLNLSILFRNIWLLSLISAFSYFVYIVLKDVDKKMTDSEALNLEVILSIIGIIGGMAFIIWLFLKFSKRLKGFKFILAFVVMIFLIIKFITSFLYDYPEIVGKSMAGFQDGKRYLVCKFCKDYKRGDVVIYTNPVNNLQYIGRIIVLPNEKVEIEKGKITIDGIQFQESYANWSGWKLDNKKTIGLNDQEYLILYDKRKLDKGEEDLIESFKINEIYLQGKFL